MVCSSTHARGPVHAEFRPPDEALNHTGSSVPETQAINLGRQVWVKGRRCAGMGLPTLSKHSSHEDRSLDFKLRDAGIACEPEFGS